MAWLLRCGHKLARWPATTRTPNLCARAFFFSIGKDDKANAVPRSRSRRKRRETVPSQHQDEETPLARPRSRSRRKRRNATRSQEDDVKTVEEMQQESLPKGKSRIVVVSPKVSSGVSHQAAKEAVRSSESWIEPARAEDATTTTEDSYIGDDEIDLKAEDVGTLIRDLESSLPEPDLDLMSRYGHDTVQAIFFSTYTHL